MPSSVPGTQCSGAEVELRVGAATQDQQLLAVINNASRLGS